MRAEALQLAAIIGEDELAECYKLYLDMFDDEDQDSTVPTMTFDSGAELPDARAFNRQVLDTSSDLGVDVESRMTREELLRSLGLESSTLLPWMNSATNTLPRALWSASMSADDASLQQRQMNQLEPQKLPKGWVELGLRDHQLAAVHAIIRLVVDDHKQGVLVADDVGVGKSGAAIGAMCMLTHYCQTTLDAEQAGRTPVFSGMLGEHDQVRSSTPHKDRLTGSAAASTLPNKRLRFESGPHMIISNSTLCSNWQNESWMWTFGMEVFTYAGGSKATKDFFAADSAWSRSRCPMHRRIIIASEPVSSQCFKSKPPPTLTKCRAKAIMSDARIFFGDRDDSKQPWESLGPSGRPDAEETLLGQILKQRIRFLSLTVDEAHSMRTQGYLYEAVCWLRDLALLILFMTATPTYTHPKVCDDQQLAGDDKY
jgi:hypothetical protein